MIQFRFDIDSLTDLQIGTPLLLELFDRYDTKAEFYLNVGKSIDRKYLFNSIHKQANTTRRSVGLLKKHGVSNFLETLIINKPLLAEPNNIRIVEMILKKGHIVGLHGGSNHGTWLYEFESLDPANLNSLFSPAYDLFTRYFGKPTHFSAPGFKTSPTLKIMLKDFGFECHGDDYGIKKIPYVDEFGLLVKPVTLIGKGTVSLIEEQTVEKRSPKDIVDRIIANSKQNTFNLLYGHPSFEGVHARHILESIILQDHA